MSSKLKTLVFFFQLFSSSVLREFASCLAPLTRPLCRYVCSVHHCAICRNAILLRLFYSTHSFNISSPHSIGLNLDHSMGFVIPHRLWCCTPMQYGNAENGNKTSASILMRIFTRTMQRSVARNSHCTAQCTVHIVNQNCTQINTMHMPKKESRTQCVLQACKRDSHAGILELLLCYTIYCLSCFVLFDVSICSLLLFSSCVLFAKWMDLQRATHC